MVDNQPTRAELEEITARPLVAVLATLNPDGSPQATPVWYRYDGETFYVTSRTGRKKVRNIKRDPRVTLVVEDTADGGNPLIVKGTAEVIEEGGEEFTHTVCIRYEGKAQGKASAESLISLAHRLGEPRVKIRITPQKIISGVQ